MAADLDVGDHFYEDECARMAIACGSNPASTRQRYGEVMSNSLDLIGLKTAAAEFAESLRDHADPRIIRHNGRQRRWETWIEANFQQVPRRAARV